MQFAETGRQWRRRSRETKRKNKPLMGLVQVAEKVYHYRETEEEKEQEMKGKKQQGRNLES